VTRIPGNDRVPLFPRPIRTANLIFESPQSPSLRNPAVGVRQLVNQLRAVVEESFGFVAVEGEVSRVSTPSSGHIYFDLIEEDSKLPAVMFRGRMRGGPPACLQAGNRVRLYGNVTIYPQGGRYQILVERAEPAGIGALLAALEELKKKLSSEGLFESERKKKIPFLPRTIGIVTSPTGAAVRDIVRTILARYPAHVLVAPTRVQGHEAPPEIVKAIEDLDRISEVDVIVIARGGGSLEDLFCFNDERVVRAIGAAKTPVVTGIGHEIDTTLADLVSDVRTATPTAAGEYVVPDRFELQNRLDELRMRCARQSRRQLRQSSIQLSALGNRLRSPREQVQLRMQRLDEYHLRLLRSVRSKHQTEVQKLAALERHLSALHPRQRILQVQTRLRDIRHRVQRAGAQIVTSGRERLEQNVGKLRALSPEAHLARGYSLVQGKHGILRSTANVARGDRLRVVLYQGAMDVAVEELLDGPFDNRASRKAEEQK